MLAMMMMMMMSDGCNLYARFAVVRSRPTYVIDAACCSSRAVV